MISVDNAPKFMTVCQSCSADKERIWQVRVTTESDHKTSQSIVVALCTHCLMVLGVRISGAVRDLKEEPDE